MALEQMIIDRNLKDGAYAKFVAELEQIVTHEETTARENVYSLHDMRSKGDFPDEDSVSRINLCDQNVRLTARVYSARLFLQALQRLSTLTCHTVERGALVAVWDCDTKTREVYLLLEKCVRHTSIILNNLRIDLATPMSPVGQALTGHAVNDVVTAVTPGGYRHLEILAVV